MLNIMIDGRQAVVKKDMSFEFVSENRRFSKSDSYTLEITFPIKGCRENINIFGDLSRLDASPKKLSFDCEIIDRSFHKRGTAIITQITDADVKCQFLEGRSGADITSPIADVYINEIDVASPSTSKSAVSPLEAWASSRDCVALPWVNDSTGTIQNKIRYADGVYKWDDDVVGLSWFPYLTTVIKRVCVTIGYSCDISEIENDESLKYLLVCNALPYAWYLPQVARALPHWTVEEFFSKLEDFLFGEFIIDHTEKSVVYMSPQSIFDNSDMVEITSDVNDFDADVFVKDSECSAMDIANVKYKESDHRLQKFYDCNSAIRKLRNADMVLEFDTLQELIDKINDKFWIREDGHRNMNLHKLYYIREDKKYFCAQCFYQDPDTKRKAMGLQNVNDFGERLVSEDEDAKSVELELVPARIDFTDFDFGFTLFCAPGSFSESSSNINTYQSFEDLMSSPDVSTGSGNNRVSGGALGVISEDEFNMEKSEYYDRIYLGWWNGVIQMPRLNPFPNVADVFAGAINNVCRFPFSLSLASENSPLSKFSRKIDVSARYNISILTDKLPSPRAVYLIKGKKYVCEKLTASFTERGMSSLVKGVFWRLSS